MHNPFGRRLDTAAIFTYHRRRLRQYGPGGPQALGWNHADGQQARFQALTQIGDLTQCSVLDAGCGYADLYPYLRQRYAGVRYHGIEQMPELLGVAQARYLGAAGITLSSGDFLRDALPATDYVLASGALNYRHRDSRFIYQAIDTLYRSCRVGLGFNLLSWEPAGGGPLAAYDPAIILAYCQQLAPRAELLQGYWEGDFTVFMYH
ncbi:MAG: class I SAM-dependent methyltransferase [Janthinobacterium lividum]